MLAHHLAATTSDTARHYMKPSFLEHILQAMEYSKVLLSLATINTHCSHEWLCVQLNILHWHITDDQSFPIESTAFPLLAKAGAFCPTCVYTHADVTSLVAAAKARGITIIPEFDEPAHCARYARCMCWTCALGKC